MFVSHLQIQDCVRTPEISERKHRMDSQSITEFHSIGSEWRTAPLSSITVVLKVGGAHTLQGGRDVTDGEKKKTTADLTG